MYVEETIEKYEKYLNPAVARLFRFMGLASVETKAEGWIITDSDGREFIDCLGGYGMFCLGHRHPKIVEAVKGALDTIPMCGEILFNRPMADLAERLAEITPGNLQYSFFVNSGTEAVEGALKIARLATGRKKYIAAQNAFHGKTYGSLTATGRDLFRKPFEPLLQNFTHVEFGNIAAMEAAIDTDTAAVILEPVQGEGGIIVPPAGYLTAVRNLCDKYGVLMIADEVQTGIGRTGKWFAVDHEGVTPDIMALAKALGGGIMPIGSFTATPEVWSGLIESPFLHTSTFGGNQMACVAGIATLKVIEEEDLLNRGAAAGAYLKKGLEEIQKDYPLVMKEVRGLGMMIDSNILIAYTLNNPKVIRMEPPLIMPIEVIDQVLAAFRKAIQQTNDVIEEL